ncbi:MAG: NAD(P)-dependent oxidoreductase [Burkholderiaceae bacterium]|nr:NAD(P)-dependent oxidoreductase [Burkholderiaceae bacterium]
MDGPPRENRPSIGIVGIGNMGLGMALRLLDCGHAVGVRDLLAEREHAARAHGAMVCADAAAAAQGRDLLIIAVVDALQTEQVLFGKRGAVRGLGPGSTVLLCPTLAPQTVEDCAARLAGHGIDCIDAPMSGGPLRARDGTMSLMVACADAVFERWQPLLRTLAGRLFRIGTRPGDGARTKLVNNLLAAINLAGAAEALALAQQLGLDPAATLAVIEASSGQSWIGSDRLRRALAADTAVHAHTALLAKDSGLAMDMAAGAGRQPRLGQAAAQVFAQACAEGLAGQDDSALWRWLAEARRPQG